MHNFAVRSPELEWMDTEPVTQEDFVACLADLEKINRWTLAYRPTLRWVKRQLGRLPKNRPVTILDAGSGGGDMLRQIWRHCGESHRLALLGMDLNPLAKVIAEQRTPPAAPIRYETCNIFALDSERRADLIVSSLFTHHLTDDEIVRFLQRMESHASVGWFINDLHRHPLPYYFIKYALRLTGFGPYVCNDAPISVMRSFTENDWKHLLREAGIPLGQVSIRWEFPFRYCVARKMP